MSINFNEDEVIIVFDGLEIRISEDKAKVLAEAINSYFDDYYEED